MKLAGKVKDFMRTEYLSIQSDEGVCKLIDSFGKEDFMIVLKDDEIVGLVTEMDVLRAIRGSDDPGGLRVVNCMSPCRVTGYESCFQISEDRPAEEALDVMTTSSVSQILVFDESKEICGVLEVGELLKSIKECKLLE